MPLDNKKPLGAGEAPAMVSPEEQLDLEQPGIFVPDWISGGETDNCGLERHQSFLLFRFGQEIK